MHSGACDIKMCIRHALSLLRVCHMAEEIKYVHNNEIWCRLMPWERIWVLQEFIEDRDSFVDGDQWRIRGGSGISAESWLPLIGRNMSWRWGGCSSCLSIKKKVEPRTSRWLFVAPAPIQWKAHSRCSINIVFWLTHRQNHWLTNRFWFFLSLEKRQKKKISFHKM